MIRGQSLKLHKQANISSMRNNGRDEKNTSENVEKEHDKTPSVEDSDNNSTGSIEIK